MTLLCENRKKICKVHVVSSFAGTPHYSVMTGAGLLDSVVPLLRGGVRAVGNLFAKSGAQDLLKRTIDSLLQTGKQEVKRIAKEALPSLAKKGADIAQEAIISKIENRKPAFDISEEIKKQIQTEVQKQAKISKQEVKNVVDPAKVEARQILKGVIDQSAQHTERQVNKARNRLSNLIAGSGHVKKKRIIAKQCGSGLRLLGD